MASRRSRPQYRHVTTGYRASRRRARSPRHAGLTPALQGFAFARCCGFSSASIPHLWASHPPFITGKVGSGSRRFRPHAVRSSSGFVPFSAALAPFRAVGEHKGQLARLHSSHSISPLAPPAFTGFAYDLWLPPAGSIRDLHPPPFIHARRTHSPYWLLPTPPTSFSQSTYSSMILLRPRH